MKLTAVLLVALAAQTAAPLRPSSTTPPDLNGTWNFSTLTPLERPQQFADREFLTDQEAAAFLSDTLSRNNRDLRDKDAQVDVGRAYNDGWFDRGTSLARVGGRIRTSLIVEPTNGRLPPLTAAARGRTTARAADANAHPADGPENRSLAERCLSFNAGPPILPGPYNNVLQIMQFPGHVVILTEMIHDARIVPLGADAARRPALPRWMGEPRGRYEAGALVVETAGFSGAVSIRGSDDQLRLRERFSRVDRNTLLYEFSVDNPSAFTQPWRAVLPMTLSEAPLYEYACHEGNYALMNILRGARVAER